jgi:hypothetical protein
VLAVQKRIEGVTDTLDEDAAIVGVGWWCHDLDVTEGVFAAAAI